MCSWRYVCGSGISIFYSVKLEKKDHIPRMMCFEFTSLHQGNKTNTSDSMALSLTTLHFGVLKYRCVHWKCCFMLAQKAYDHIKGIEHLKL